MTAGPDGALWFVAAGREPHRPDHDAGSRHPVAASDGRRQPLEHHRRRGREPLVLGRGREQDREDHSDGDDHGVPAPEHRNARLPDARSRRERLVLDLSRRQDRPDHSGGRDHRLPAAGYLRQPVRGHGRAGRGDLVHGIHGNRVARITTGPAIPKPGEVDARAVAGYATRTVTAFSNRVRRSRSIRPGRIRCSSPASLTGTGTSFTGPGGRELHDRRLIRRLRQRRRGSHPTATTRPGTATS